MVADGCPSLLEQRKKKKQRADQDGAQQNHEQSFKPHEKRKIKAPLTVSAYLDLLLQ